MGPHFLVAYLYPVTHFGPFWTSWSILAIRVNLAIWAILSFQTCYFHHLLASGDIFLPVGHFGHWAILAQNGPFWVDWVKWTMWSILGKRTIWGLRNMLYSSLWPILRMQVLLGRYDYFITFTVIITFTGLINKPVNVITTVNVITLYKNDILLIWRVWVGATLFGGLFVSCDPFWTILDQLVHFGHNG